MAATTDGNIFKTRAAKAEDQKEATSKAFTQIINSEMAKRIAKTKRLRAERLEHEATLPQPEPTPPKRSKRKQA